MEAITKRTLAKKNSETEKLEKSKKSHLRMISSSAARLKLKHGRNEDMNKDPGDTEAKNIRMYETHYPGFCYLRNGEYRRKLSSNTASLSLDPIQCSAKIKAILFTKGELDIYKTMCLHLMGTHIQNKNHIQRKDGRLCSYVKAQTTGNTFHSLQPFSQRVSSQINETPTKYDKMLPRYILDVKILQYEMSTPETKTHDVDSGSDEETKKKRKLLVPIYINNEIRMIVNSVMEALEAVESSKLNALKELASSPEELRNMLTNEDLQDYIIELASNPLVLKPTSYDYVMAHLMFDKIPEKGTLETVAQVLEVYDDSELRSSLSQIRRAILQRHLQLMNSNILPRKRVGVHDKYSLTENNSKMSNSSFNSSLGFILNPSLEVEEDVNQKDENVKPSTGLSISSEKENQKNSKKKRKSSVKGEWKGTSMNLEKTSVDEHETSFYQDESYIYDESRESYTQSRGSTDSNKCDLHNLTNSQRILLGLKVASLKCKPINMHQFEGKKKVDLGAIISPIVRPQITDVDYKQNSPENHLRNFSLPEKKVRRSTNKVTTTESADLENLTRSLLANLRLEISEIENKRRVNQFMATI